MRMVPVLVEAPPVEPVNTTLGRSEPLSAPLMPLVMMIVPVLTNWLLILKLTPSFPVTPPKVTVPLLTK